MTQVNYIRIFLRLCHLDFEMYIKRFCCELQKTSCHQVGYSYFTGRETRSLWGNCLIQGSPLVMPCSNWGNWGSMVWCVMFSTFQKESFSLEDVLFCFHQWRTVLEQDDYGLWTYTVLGLRLSSVTCHPGPLGRPLSFLNFNFTICKMGRVGMTAEAASWVVARIQCDSVAKLSFRYCGAFR